MKPEPASEQDWTIHSINIQGVFFERWCQSLVTKSSWNLKSVNYPVEFPPPNGPIRGKESTLDIRAELRRGDTLLTMLVECKKNNPEFINWIFFSKHPLCSLNSAVFNQIDNTPRPAPNVGWNVQASLRGVSLKVPLADEARETRGSYLEYKKGDKTKTSNSAISDAAYQISLATQAIAEEECRFSRSLGYGTGPIPWLKQVLLPTVVTSARIFTCDFDPSDVNPATGELPYDKAQISEQPYVLFEYSLPRHLQGAPADLLGALNSGGLEWFTRMHIMILHSGNFAGVLPQLAELAS